LMECRVAFAPDGARIVSPDETRVVSTLSPDETHVVSTDGTRVVSPLGCGRAFGAGCEGWEGEAKDVAEAAR
jgi:hypothetical protein